MKMNAFSVSEKFYIQGFNRNASTTNLEIKLLPQEQVEEQIRTYIARISRQL